MDFSENALVAAGASSLSLLDQAIPYTNHEVTFIIFLAES